jgi:hypothetical protein
MEKWSRIHTTFKYFHMGRPPKLHVIEQSPTWKKRIDRLNRVRAYYKRKNLNSLDFRGRRVGQIDTQLKKILRKIEAARR